MKIKIKDIITPSPHRIGPDMSLVEAAVEMKALDAGWLPVCEHDRLIGTVTDRDIAIRAVAGGVDPNITAVRQVMSRVVIYCFGDQDIWHAAQMMETHKVRRLPVLNRDNRLVGIVSLGDLVVRTGEENLAGRILERVSEPGPSWHAA
jgi:CBS domain-containing protein